MVHIGGTGAVVLYPEPVTVFYFPGLFVGIGFNYHVAIRFVYYDIHRTFKRVRVFSGSGKLYRTSARATVLFGESGQIREKTLSSVLGLPFLCIDCNFHCQPSIISVLIISPCSARAKTEIE